MKFLSRMNRMALQSISIFGVDLVRNGFGLGMQCNLVEFLLLLYGFVELLNLVLLVAFLIKLKCLIASNLYMMDWMKMV